MNTLSVANYDNKDFIVQKPTFNRYKILNQRKFYPKTKTRDSKGKAVFCWDFGSTLSLSGISYGFSKRGENKPFFNISRKSTQYNLFKNGNLDYLDVNDDESTDNKVDNFKQPLDESNPTEEKDYINEFLKSLIPRQRELVIKLLDGFKAIELAKELNISRQAVSESIKYIKVKFNKYNESTTSKM